MGAAEPNQTTNVAHNGGRPEDFWHSLGADPQVFASWKLALVEKDLVPTPTALRCSWERCGQEMRLIVPGVADKGTPPRYDAALIKAIARGHSWHQRLISGKTGSVEALARELGFTKRYVNRIIRCALLAPDIVERILEGRQPPELTLNRLFKDIPADWGEQRRVFGITAH